MRIRASERAIQAVEGVKVLCRAGADNVRRNNLYQCQ